MLQSVLEARCKALQSENISHQRWRLELLSRSWHKNTSKHDAKTDAEPKNDASRNYLNWVLHYMHVFHVPSVFYFVYFWPFFHHMTSQIWICAMPQNIRDSREIPEIAHALTTRVGLDLSYMVHDDGFFFCCCCICMTRSQSGTWQTGLGLSQLVQNATVGLQM